MKIRPINKRVICKIYQEEKKNQVILTVSQDPKDKYIVVDVCQNDENIKIGDLILCNNFDVLEKEIEGEKFYIIHIERVIGVIE